MLFYRVLCVTVVDYKYVLIRLSQLTTAQIITSSQVQQLAAGAGGAQPVATLVKTSGGGGVTPGGATMPSVSIPLSGAVSFGTISVSVPQQKTVVGEGGGGDPWGGVAGFVRVLENPEYHGIHNLVFQA